MNDYAEKDLYLEGWTKQQVTIWLEKLERLKVIDTGNLHESFRSEVQKVQGGESIEFRFAKYGIYVALGVGRGYVQGNGGDLEFLDEDYRKLHRLDRPRKVGPAWGGGMTSGNPRERRDWMNRPLYKSIMKLRDQLGSLTAEQAASVICEALTNSRAAL